MEEEGSAADWTWTPGLEEEGLAADRKPRLEEGPATAPKS
jgi:hypothetical protein